MSGYGQGLYGAGLYGPATVLVATDQDVWPTRVLVSATGLGIGVDADIYRVVGSARTVLRGAAAVVTADQALVTVDAELPFGTPVSYVLVVDGADAATTAAATHTLVGGKVAITDAIAGAASEVVITAWPTRARDRVASTYRVGGRTVVVAGPLGDPAGDVEVLVTTDLARTGLLGLLDGATAATVQLRQPGGYDGVDCYLTITAVVEARISQDGTDPRRKITLSGVEVEAWPGTYEARGWTLADIDTAYTGLTLADLAGDYPTLLAVAQHDWGL
jgi:hypothetical protein